jgi:hypothetical protein
MALDDKSGIEGENLTVAIQLDTISGLHVSFTRQVSNQLVLEVADRDECCGIVWDKILRVDGTLKNTTILVDGILGERDYGDPLGAIEIRVVDI